MPVRQVPTKLKLMCSPDFWGKIRCRMVRVEKRTKRGWNHFVKRGRKKRKPQVEWKPQHEPNLWSPSQGETMEMKHVKRENTKYQDVKWVPIFEKQEREARFKDEKRYKVRQAVRGKQKNKSIVNMHSTKSARETSGIQVLKIGEEGKVLKVKGAQIVIIPPTKKTKDKSSSRMFYI